LSNLGVRGIRHRISEHHGGRTGRGGLHRDAIAAGEDDPDRYLPRWPWPPVIRERAAWIMQNDLPVPDRTRDIRWAVRIFTVVAAGLAIYGAWVRYVIAKGH
jgi:hypothetical protein